jgi:hypothetical protein
VHWPRCSCYSACRVRGQELSQPFSMPPSQETSEELMGTLTAMGFPEDRIRFAIEATGATNLEILASWLLENADRPLEVRLGQLELNGGACQRGR